MSRSWEATRRALPVLIWFQREPGQKPAESVSYWPRPSLVESLGSEQSDTPGRGFALPALVELILAIEYELRRSEKYWFGFPEPQCSSQR